MTVKLQNVLDAKTVFVQAEAHLAECKVDYEQQARAFLAHKWGCREGVQVINTKTGKIGIVDEITLYTIHGFEPDNPHKPWLKVRPLKKDGEPGENVQSWFDDWDIA